MNFNQDEGAHDDQQMDVVPLDHSDNQAHVEAKCEQEKTIYRLSTCSEPTCQKGSSLAANKTKNITSSSSDRANKQQHDCSRGQPWWLVERDNRFHLWELWHTSQLGYTTDGSPLWTGGAAQELECLRAIWTSSTPDPESWRSVGRETSQHHSSMCGRKSQTGRLHLEAMCHGDEQQNRENEGWIPSKEQVSAYFWTKITRIPNLESLIFHSSTSQRTRRLSELSGTTQGQLYPKLTDNLKPSPL